MQYQCFDMAENAAQFPQRWRSKEKSDEMLRNINRSIWQ